ncbi:THO complex subunit 5 homolog [Antedon mediterranea]|uniref:THO complex subunit 5 homolog n=1 Tax=Antedon mediterranea TaxID=105859 RepID=UPI003AF5652B
MSEKKKRRIVEASSESTRSVVISGSSKESKKIKRSTSSDQTKQQVHHEEVEVELRDPQKDLEFFQSNCQELRNIMKDIYEMKTGSSANVTEKITEKRMEAVLHFIAMKKLNRLAHIHNKKARDSTEEAKEKVDVLHLQLQNLLYEVMHLQKEITKCLEFKSTDEDIELVDVDDFYHEAPKEVSNPNITKADIHSQRLARLDWELQQRKSLSEKFKEFQEKKNEIVKEIEQKKEYLESLQPMLDTILQSTLPVQEYLSMPLESIRSQHQMAKLLPRPLYILYVQANAYHEACDENISLKIEGDKESALSDETATPDLDSDSDSDNEELSKSKRRRKTIGNVMEEKRQKTLRKHPLSVVMTIKCKDDVTLILTFSYLSVLQITTVMINMQCGTNASNSSDILSTNTLLKGLFPGDHGTESPNPANYYQLNKLGLNSLSSFISVIGHPYRWVQHLCGLDFLETDGERNDVKPASSISVSHIESTINAIKRRIAARLALNKQLAALERRNITVPSSCQSLFPAKISSKLVSWKLITSEDFQALPFTQDVNEKIAPKELNMFFMAIIEQGSARLKAAVILGLDYPIKVPYFVLNLSWKGEHYAGNNNAIRDMESEVNVFYKEFAVEKSCDHILSNQLQRLLMCLDVYVETESAAKGREGPIEFAKEKMFPRLSRGKDRQKPFNYKNQFGYFTFRT